MSQRFAERGNSHLEIEFERGLGLVSSAMGKSKMAATGRGYLGEIMVHRISHAVGVVDSIVEAQSGWPPEITLKLKDGSVKKGKLSDFKEASGEQKKEFGSQ